MTLLNEPDLQVLLTRLIHDLAINWDGKIVTADGLRRLDIRLAIDLDRTETWWVIPLVPGQSLMRLANKPERAHSGSANPDGLNSAVVESVQTLGR